MSDTSRTAREFSEYWLRGGNASLEESEHYLTVLSAEYLGLAAKMAEPTDTPLYVWMPDGTRSEWAIVDGYWRRTDKRAEPTLRLDVPLRLVCGALEPCMRDEELQPGDPGTPCTFDPPYTWDTLHRTQDGGYWIPPSDILDRALMRSVKVIPNKYTQIGTEPEKQWTDRERERGAKVAAACAVDRGGR